jgi:hypothetical protein
VAGTDLEWAKFIFKTLHHSRANKFRTESLIIISSSESLRSYLSHMDWINLLAEEVTSDTNKPLDFNSFPRQSLLAQEGAMDDLPIAEIRLVSPRTPYRKFQFIADGDVKSFIDFRPDPGSQR